MSNIINNLLLNEPPVSTTTTSEQVVKEAPSLFDSLLSTATSSKEINTVDNSSVATKNVEVNVPKVENTKIEIPKDIDATKVNEQNQVQIVIEDNKEAVNNSTSSLLDKLVIEAKKDIGKENLLTNVMDSSPALNGNPENISTNKSELLNTVIEVSNKIENADTIKVETPKESVVNNKEEVKIDAVVETLELNKVVEDNTTDENQKVVNNATSSLLDKLIIEAKKDLDKTNSKDLLLNKIVDSTVSENIVKVEMPIEAVVETAELNKISEDNTTNSLLDKLVIEAKKDLDKTNNKNVSLNKIVDSTVSADMVKIEMPTEVVVENKETVKVDLKLDTSQTTADIIAPEENEILISDVETVSIVESKDLSLMDKLIQKTTEKVVLIDANNIATETSTKKVVSEDLITNIYLGSQKNQLNNQSLFNKKEAVTLLKEGTNVQAIKVSAEMLDLGLENIDIQQAKDDKLEIKKTTIDIVDKKNIIDNILSQKNVKSEEVKNLITQSVEASKALLKDELNLAEDSVVNVNSPLSYNIQSKIIGAKQQMATMMSDIARQMYENYKPPVTAFRINLNPTELGSIAILMKNDKNSGLSISMSVSNSVTLDTLMENQNVLKNSLNKTFNENTKFDLDFTSSNENSNNQSSNNQDNQQNNRRFEQQIDTQSILQLQEENKDREEKILDYM